MVEKILPTPFQKFIKIESLSGILLFGATIIAIIWANSPWNYIYESIFDFKLGVKSEIFELNKPLILWINDGLMAVFFFVIGLEIKREVLIGELNSFRKASFPLFAAIGGMLVPLFVFLFLNNNPDTRDAWGIPMATDIAFSLAILQLLGKRVPLSLKIFLIAFAIVDDIGAVMIIALFYSSGVKWTLLLYAFVLLLILYYLSYREIYLKYFVLISAGVIWVLFLKAGLHPTIAGVLAAFAIPIRRKLDIKTYADKLKDIAYKIRVCCDDNTPVLSKIQIEEIDNLEDWTNKVQSPLQHLEHKLHNWVAFFIMPVFALANAGVEINADTSFDIPLIINIALALFIGKAVGISLFSYLGMKLKLADLPSGLNMMHIIGVAMIAGVGFTMSIFIANLAFTQNILYMDSAKIGILMGSIISGLGGYLILHFAGRKT